MNSVVIFYSNTVCAIVTDVILENVDDVKIAKSVLKLWLEKHLIPEKNQGAYTAQFVPNVKDYQKLKNCKDVFTC